MDLERNKRRSMAEETLQIIKSGEYSACGRTVKIADDIRFSRENSVLITQSESDLLHNSFSDKSGEFKFELTGESTLSAIHRLCDKQNLHIGVLNFASAKNPGGGFLNGAIAQEESLAVAGSLYNSQIKHSQYYETNRSIRRMTYTDTAIWSPNVVFFRDDTGALLDSPVKASVLTLPAVNMGQVRVKGEDEDEAEKIMRRRMKIALAVFADKSTDGVILGAYGCGVFRNDPNKIAQWWRELLPVYGGYYKHVVIAVLDRSKTRNVYRAFENSFGQENYNGAK